jgi:hypothetical protein
MTIKDKPPCRASSLPTPKQKKWVISKTLDKKGAKKTAYTRETIKTERKTRKHRKVRADPESDREKKRKKPETSCS